jgi:subtilisin family serine protease
MRDSKTNAPSGVCARLSWEVAALLGCQDWLADSSPKNRPHAKRRPLRIEPLEVRHLMDAAGLASLIAPSWFQSVANLTGPEHAGAATWTAQDTLVQTPATSTTQSTQSNLYDWIVQFDTASLAGITSVAQTTSLLVGGGIEFAAIRGLGLAGQVLVRSSGASLEAVENWLAHDSDVAAFEQDAVREFQKVSNDPQLSQLWGMTKINAQGAWNLSTGSKSVVVAVIDTGVDYTHSDLAANIWTNPGEIAGNGRDDDGNGFTNDIHGYDFANNDSDPTDDNSHGTHVSGTIAGVGNNGQGVAGVNWAVSIMPLKFLNSQGSGYLSDAIRAINYATMERTRYGVNVRVMNNSWGGGSFSAAMQNAIQAAGDAGILFVAAAGNSGTNNDLSPQYPANYAPSNVISVAASDRNDRLASFSCYGAATVDIAAPGVSIYSTIPGNRYATYSGTSMATPMVSGVAALCWAANPNATVAQVRDAILRGVDPVAALAGKVASGGRLDAYNTLRLLGAQPQQGPAISSLTASPGSVTVGSLVTLAAHGVTNSTAVSFFLDANNNGQYDAGDTSVGSDTTIVGGEASFGFNTANLGAGTRQFLARSRDAAGHWSTATATTLTLLASDDHGNNAAASTAVGVPSSMLGTIGVKGDVDWFKFQAAAGKTYTFSTQLGTLPDSILTLYNRNGTSVLASNDDYGSSLASRITWKAPASGTYYLAVGAYGNVYAGSYTLSVQTPGASSSLAGKSLSMPAALADNALAWMALESRTLGSASHDAASTLASISPLAYSAAVWHDDAFARLAASDGFLAPSNAWGTFPDGRVRFDSSEPLTPTRDHTSAEDWVAPNLIEQRAVDEILDLLSVQQVSHGK